MDHLHHFYFTAQEKRFHVRPINPSDKDLFQKGFSELSERSKFLRFFSIPRKLTKSQLHYLTEVDGMNHVAWGILDTSGDEAKPVAVGRFVKLNKDSDTAELAITVVDSYQHKGIAKVLAAVLHIVAAQVGVNQFRGYVLEENNYILEILKHFEILKRAKNNHLMIVDIKVFPNHTTIPKSAAMQHFIQIMKKTELAMKGEPFSL